MACGNRGVALIITLWVLVLMSVLALGFSSTVRRESKGARNFAEDTRLHFAAVSAYEEALRWLASDPEPGVDFIDGDEVFRTDLEREPFTGIRNNSGYTVEVTVSDEEARLNLNILNEYSLRRLLEHVGVHDEKIPELLDAFMDWRDKDDLHRLNGAEDDYYEAFGYSAKNGRFDSPEELFLIKGFFPEPSEEVSEEVSEEDSSEEAREVVASLLPLISAWGQGINVNSAPPEILDVLGLDSEAIEAIMKAREEQRSIRTVPHGMKHKGKISSAYYRIEVKAWLDNGPWTVVITSVVKRQKGPGGQELKPIYWKETRETRSA